MNNRYNSFKCWRCGVLTFEDTLSEEDMKQAIKLHSCVHRMKDYMDAYGEVSIPVKLWQDPEGLDKYLDELERNVKIRPPN